MFLKIILDERHQLRMQKTDAFLQKENADGIEPSTTMRSFGFCHTDFSLYSRKKGLSCHDFKGRFGTGLGNACSEMKNIGENADGVEPPKTLRSSCQGRKRCVYTALY